MIIPIIRKARSSCRLQHPESTSTIGLRSLREQEPSFGALDSTLCTWSLADTGELAMTTVEDDSSVLTDLSSELSSTRSLSPPANYPSPVSSQEPDIAINRLADLSQKRPREDDGSVPVRKRKRPNPKPRTTQFLNLMPHQVDLVEQKEQCDLLLKVLRKRRKIVVIAGAGISVSAGSKSWYISSFACTPC